MATVHYSHQLDTAALRRVLSSERGGLGRDLLRRGLKVETQAKRNLAGGPSGPKRIDSGRLRSSVTTVMVERNGDLAVLIGTNVRYARYVHDGTGIYGPRRQMIRPKRAKLLRFKPKGSSRYVFAKQVRGMVPNMFLVSALSAARD
jgi:hypothetical protein